MATRRKASGAAGASMDSLMDTLTNVVGVLIIILILVQINVSQALKKIISELPPASIEEVQQLREQAAKQKTTLDSAQKNAEQLQKEADAARKELTKIEPELKALETTAEKTKAPLLDLASLRKQLEEKRVLVTKTKTEMAALLTEQEKLKAVLAETPMVAPPAAKVVRVPNSRPVPEKATIEKFLIAGKQVYYLDFDAAMKLFASEFNANRTRFEKEKTKTATGERKIIYDQTKISQHFEQRRLAVRNLDLRVPINKFSTRLALQLIARPAQGEPIDAAVRMTSLFQGNLRRFKNGNNVIWLYVARDSLDAYTQARDAVDVLGLPAGWEIAGAPSVSQGIPDIEVARLEEPPPADPNAIIIAPPKKTLD